VLTATPDRRRRPSGGLVVEASILARLLRIRLLRLDATVVISPADVTLRPSAARDAKRSASSPLRAARTSLPMRSEPSGGRALAEAVRTIDEGAAILAQTRRNAAHGRTTQNGRA